METKKPAKTEKVIKRDDDKVVRTINSLPAEELAKAIKSALAKEREK